MPIRIPDSLPATEVLEGENIFVMTEYRAMHQDIRPLKVLLLNLMPTKIVTETQIMRKLSNTPLQIDVNLLQTASHAAKNVSEQHLDTFYTTFDDIKDQRFDGMIITGARWSCSTSRTWTTGTSSPASWIGPPRTCTPRSTSAGARRPASTTTTASPSTSWRTSCSACSITTW